MTLISLNLNKPCTICKGLKVVRRCNFDVVGFELFPARTAELRRT